MSKVCHLDYRDGNQVNQSDFKYSIFSFFLKSNQIASVLIFRYDSPMADMFEDLELTKCSRSCREATSVWES